MSISKRLTDTMTKTFSSTKDRRKAIHLTAVAAAAIIAVLPIGIDAWALRLAEITMIICIASSYGEKLTKSAAKGLLVSSFAQLAGETAAYATLEFLEGSKVATAASGFGPVAAYAAKTTIAVTLIEAVGNLVIEYYENPNSLGSTACETVEKIGAIADASRLSLLVFNSLEQVMNNPTSSNSDVISFKGASSDDAMHEINQKKRELRKIIKENQNLTDSKAKEIVWNAKNAEQKLEFMENDIILKRSVKNNYSDYMRYATNLTLKL